MTLLFFVSLPIFAAEEPLNSKTLFKSADVVLEVIALKVRPVDSGMSVDAVEGDAQHLAVAEAAVSFKIRRVLKGQWAPVKAGGPSRMDQAQRAMQKKDYMKILTLNFSDPNREMPREWVSVAVEDPGKSFGINSWDNPEPRRTKIYLQRVPGRPESYWMIGALPS